MQGVRAHCYGASENAKALETRSIPEAAPYPHQAFTEPRMALSTCDTVSCARTRPHANCEPRVRQGLIEP